MLLGFAAWLVLGFAALNPTYGHYGGSRRSPGAVSAVSAPNLAGRAQRGDRRWMGRASDRKVGTAFRMNLMRKQRLIRPKSLSP
jgi:hypothetical protein